MGTKPTGGTVSTKEAEGHTHAPDTSGAPRVEDEPETYACGANVGELASGRPTCPRCVVRTTSLHEAQCKLSNEVYEASRLVEWLEHAGKWRGNGHHARQRLAALGEEILAKGWADPGAQAPGPSGTRTPKVDVGEVTDELRAASLQDAQRALGYEVYEASRLVEDLERAKRWFGDGHRARRRLMALAEEILAEGWRGPPGDVSTDEAAR